MTTGGDRRASHGTAFVVKNHEQYILFNEQGELKFVTMSSDGYRASAGAPILEPTGDCFGRPVVWSHPAFANKCMFARNDKELVCVSLASE
ncbi:MAG: hypothetical protein R3C53_21615 [Pirellulaceae bacterium]